MQVTVYFTMTMICLCKFDLSIISVRKKILDLKLRVDLKKKI